MVSSKDVIKKFNYNLYKKISELLLQKAYKSSRIKNNKYKFMLESTINWFFLV